MKTSQHVIGTVWNDGMHHDTFSETTLEFESVHDAERRATLVFDMLLTYLGGDELVMPRKPSLTY